MPEQSIATSWNITINTLTTLVHQGCKGMFKQRGIYLNGKSVTQKKKKVMSLLDAEVRISQLEMVLIRVKNVAKS